MSEIAEMTGYRGLVLCANGAVHFDLTTNEIVHTDFVGSNIT
jgi:hypothetical protein